MIDQALMSLNISGPTDGPAVPYADFAALAERLKRGEDYEVDERAGTIALLEHGIARVEREKGLDNLYESANAALLGHLNRALHAKELLQPGRDYFVENGRIVIVDERAEALMMRRHRFIIDAWVREPPGGYPNEGEDPAACAAREAEEETGWRPGRVEHLATFQPMTGTADAENHVFLGLDPIRVEGALEVNEAQALRWIPLAEVPALIGSMTLGAGSVIGLLAVRDRLGVR
jgi:8-oxo-dGTP pyrophosphatase MutT (NUDIX family)